MDIIPELRLGDSSPALQRNYINVTVYHALQLGDKYPIV